MNKTPFALIFATALFSVSFGCHGLFAQSTIYKSSNNDNLDQLSSWWTSAGGSTPPGVIGSTDTLWFGNGMGEAKTLSLGADLSVGALRVDNNSGSPNYGVTINSGNTITLNGNTLYSGTSGIVLNSSSGGSMTINSDIVLGNSQQWVSSRNLTVNGNVDNGGNTLTLWQAGGTGTINGIISGSGGLTKDFNTALTVLAGENTYTGTTRVNRGVLSITGNGKLGGLAGSSNDANNIVFGNNQNSGTIRFETAANLGVADQIRFRNTGGTVGSGGMLEYVGTTDETLSKTIQCDTSIGIRLSSNSVGGSLTFDGAFSASSSRPFYLEGTGTGDNTVASNIGLASVTKRGSGKWVLTGSNTHGTTTVNEGTLQIGDGGTTGTFGSGAVTIADGAEVIIDRSATYNVGNAITGTGTLKLRGGSATLGSNTSVWVALNNAGTGGFHLDTGVSSSDRAEAIITNFHNSGSLSLASLSGYGNFRSDWGTSGFRTISVDQEIDTEYQGRFLNSSATRGIDLEKLGTGTLTLSGANNHRNTTVTAGTLIVNGVQTDGGVVSVGALGTLSGSGTIGGATTVAGNLNPGNSPGTLTFNEDLTLESTATTTLEFASLASFDVLANDGGDLLTGGGTLTLTSLGYSATNGDSFQVFDNWSGFAGSFSSITGTDLGNGLVFDTSNLLVDGTLSVVSAVPEPGSCGLLALLMFGISTRRKRIA